MDLLDKTSWEILNATADDCENLEQIYLSICYEPSSDRHDHPNDFSHFRARKDAPLLSELADRIPTLVSQGLLAIEMDEDGHPWQERDDLSYVWRAWFTMTPQGKTLWLSSECLVDPEYLS
jgi:hypothetical protein